MQGIACFGGRVRRQSGVALAFGLIFLLILTVIGVTAVRASTQQARMASSYQSQVETFQAAEAAIAGVMDELRGLGAAPEESLLSEAMEAGLVGSSDPIPADAPERLFTLGARVSSKAVVTYRGQAPTTGTSMSVGNGGIVAYRFRIDGTSAITSTQAQAEHWQGVQRLGPGS